MDIRYIIWAGYDFVGPEAITGFQGTPDMYGETQGTIRVAMDASSPVIGPNIGKIIQNKPDVRSSQVIKPPSMKAEDLRPFPSPRNT